MRNNSLCFVRVVFKKTKSMFFLWCVSRYFVCVRHVIAIRSPHFGNPSAAVGIRFIAPAYTYSPRIRNPFRMHSRNVRNVFVICVLHIRRVKVWFLRCKKWVFTLQKGGFCIAKVWFLFFECCVVAIRQQHY